MKLVGNQMAFVVALVKASTTSKQLSAKTPVLVSVMVQRMAGEFSLEQMTHAGMAVRGPLKQPKQGTPNRGPWKVWHCWLEALTPGLVQEDELDAPERDGAKKS